MPRGTRADKVLAVYSNSCCLDNLLLDLYILGTGQYSWCLGIESILMKYYDMILQPPLRLSTHVMEASVKKY